MRIFRLRTYDLPDVGDHLIHFTGRNGRRINVEPAIMALPAQERLLRILVDKNASGDRSVTGMSGNRATLIIAGEMAAELADTGGSNMIKQLQEQLTSGLRDATEAV